MARLTVTFKKRDGTYIENPFGTLPEAPPQATTQELMKPKPTPRNQLPPSKVDSQIFRKKGR